MSSMSFPSSGLPKQNDQEGVCVCVGVGGGWGVYLSLLEQAFEQTTDAPVNSN